MNTNRTVNNIKSQLASHFIFADEEWLKGCIEYLTEDSNQSFSENEIFNLAKEQWMLNDLKDICPGCLPCNLKSIKSTTLNGRFIVQINAAIDIGTPAYQQYLKLQKVNTENIEATVTHDEKIPSHRMIKLYLTDGVQDVTAIEYRPMRNLSCDITPGCKMMIKGPVDCRRGVIMLAENTMELLGGEVQEIAVSNSLAGLLSSKLSLPITQDLNKSVSHTRNTNIPTPHDVMPAVAEETPLHPSESSGTHIEQGDNSFVDDDINIEQLAAIEAMIMENPSKRSIDYDENPKPEKQIKLDSVPTQNRTQDYPEDDDVFCDEDEDYLREVESKFDERENVLSKTIGVSSEPFVYIKQINEMNEIDKAGRVFKIKGQIIKLLSKLSVGKDEWSLKCTIVDGTGNLDVDFTSDVLSKLVGYTPQEMNNLKKQMAEKPELKKKAVAALLKAKETLQMLYCIIELTLIEGPKITNLIPFEEYHVELLKKRQQSL